MIRNAHSVIAFLIQFVEQMELLMPIFANSENAPELMLPIWDHVEFPTSNLIFPPVTAHSTLLLSVDKITSPINPSV